MPRGYSVFERLRHVHEAPFVNLRHSLWWLRKTFFTRQRRDSAAFVVPLEKGEAVRLLGRNYFGSGWEVSYNYQGEIINLRRPEYHEADTEHVWWQVHVRGYDHPGGLELTAHFETDPTEHPDAHIRRVGIDEERGLRALGVILDRHDVPYERVEGPGAGPEAES